MTPPHAKRFGLQLKLVIGLLVIASVPLLASALLIPQIAELAQNFASEEAAALRPPLERARAAYADLVEARKEVYRQKGARIAQALRGEPLWDDAMDHAALERELGRLLAQEELQRVAVRGPDGAVLGNAVSALLPGEATGRWREFDVTEAMPGGMALEMTFVTRVDFLDDLRELGYVLNERENVAAVRRALPSAYRTAFLLIVGGIVVVVTAAGIAVARRLTRRIERLASATRDVAAGDLTSRVHLEGTDELAELATSFNRMVDQLEIDRQQIGYLQKMSAWQDVARRLAHEIKNPLTPIQLAVQQCVSTYKGDDPRFEKTLADAKEIVEEEIAGLRRLVDAFRSLGRLPVAKLVPLDVAVVVGDLERDPEVCDHIVVDAPDDDVVVAGDRLLLRRVLANLVENGIHASDGGKVTIGWRAGAGVAVITVDDEGPGIPEAKRETIFDPYVTTKEHGTGLGLAIAKKIALDHRGEIALSPDPAPTGGARFVLTVPLAA